MTSLMPTLLEAPIHKLGVRVIEEICAFQKNFPGGQPECWDDIFVTVQGGGHKIVVGIARHDPLAVSCGVQ